MKELDLPPMSSKWCQPGRQWIPLHGDLKGKVGTECCGSERFEYVGLMFPGRTSYVAFPLDDLEPTDSPLLLGISLPLELWSGASAGCKTESGSRG